MLSLNLSSIIFTVINLLVLVYFVHRFLFKPVRAALKARQDELDTSYREAEAKIEAQRQAEQKQHEMEEEVAMLVAKAAYKIAASKDSVENNQKLYDTFLEDAEKKE